MGLLPWLILPTLAASAIAYLFLRPLVMLWKCPTLEQGSSRMGSVELQRLATEREQQDEFETLLELGFEPMGTAWDQYAFMGNRDNDHSIILRHRDFPVSACLCINVDKQRYVKLLTNDSTGRLLTTSSCPFSPIVDEPGYKAQVIEAAYTEQVFEAHMRALGEWESSGFRGLAINEFEEYYQQSRDEVKKPSVAKLLRGCILSSVFGSLLVTAVMPIFFTAMIGIAMMQLFGIWGIAQVASLWSLGSSVFWFKTVVNIRENQTQNSLRGQANIQPATALELKVAESGQLDFELPNRDTTPVKGYAQMYLGVGCFAAVFVSMVAFTVIRAFLAMGNLNVMTFVSMGIPFLACFGMLYQGAPMLGLVFHALRGTSRNHLSIKEGALHSSEETWLNNFGQSMPLKKIAGIRVEQLKQRDDLIRWFAEANIDSWGVVEVYDIKGKRIDIGAGYEISTAVELANQLRTHLDLEPEVKLSPAIQELTSEEAKIVPAVKPVPYVIPFGENSDTPNPV